MKMTDHEMDAMLQRALHSNESPSGALIQKTKQKLAREGLTMNKSKFFKRSFTTVAAAIITILLTGTTVFAALYFMPPGEVADSFGNPALSAAFEGENAISINETKSDGGYDFTLLGVVTGSDISDLPYYSSDMQDDRTYAVLAIRNSDGTPMPDEFGIDDTRFFASPLVKGQKPWQLNIFSMNGAHTEDVVDGILYRLVECDGMAMFADRGLYFAVSSGSVFYDTNAFVYDEASGIVTPNESFDGASVIFDLPLDKSLADPEKAQVYLDNNIGTAPPETGSRENPAGQNALASPSFEDNIDWDSATGLTETFQALTVDEDGYIHYSYEHEYYGSGRLTFRFDDYFADDGTEQQQIVQVSTSSDGIINHTTGVRVTLNENGGLTAILLALPETAVTPEQQAAQQAA